MMPKVGRLPSEYVGYTNLPKNYIFGKALCDATRFQRCKSVKKCKAFANQSVGKMRLNLCRKVKIKIWNVTQ